MIGRDCTKVAEAIERLSEAGYEMELTLILEIGIRPHVEDDREARRTSCWRSTMDLGCSK